MGGHNIIRQGSETISVRCDRMHVARSGSASGPDLAGSIAGIEYQGATVHLAVATASSGELSVILPDQQFFSQPFEVGETAHVQWAEADVHRLGPSSL
jgi:putative spermidine/putrescine transport system ATP-binding protein